MSSSRELTTSLELILHKDRSHKTSRYEDDLVSRDLHNLFSRYEDELIARDPKMVHLLPPMRAPRLTPSWAPKGYTAMGTPRLRNYLPPGEGSHESMTRRPLRAQAPCPAGKGPNSIRRSPGAMFSGSSQAPARIHSFPFQRLHRLSNQGPSSPYTRPQTSTTVGPARPRKCATRHP